MKRDELNFITNLLSNHHLTKKQLKKIIFLIKTHINESYVSNVLQESSLSLNNIRNILNLDKIQNELKALQIELKNISNRKDLDYNNINKKHEIQRNINFPIISDNRHDIKFKNIGKEIKTKNKIIFKKNHSPKEMISYLNNFCNHETTKWFIYNPEESNEKINYINCLEQFKESKILNQNYNLNLSTKSFIREFILSKMIRIQYPYFYSRLTYHNETIFNKLKNGENPFKIVVNGVFFTDIIKRFKNAIEFRLNGDYEYKFNFLIKNFISEKIPSDFIAIYSDRFNLLGNTLSTYIDMNNFFRGLSIIIKWINNYKDTLTAIKIDLEEKDDSYNFIIFHQGAYSQNSPHSEKMKGLSGDLSRLRKTWFSIVDLEIQADFRNENNSFSYSIICLDQESKMYIRKDSPVILNENKIKQIDFPIYGIKYIIKIYKNQSQQQLFSIW